MKVKYECPNCEADMYGLLGDIVMCNNCFKVFDTDYEDTGKGFESWVTEEIIDEEEE